MPKNKTNSDADQNQVVRQVPTMANVHDEFAEAFRESNKLPTWVYVGRPAMERLLAPFFARGAGTKFLDLGSASGRIETDLLLPHGVAARDITGVEISPRQVEMAKARIPGANFILGDITNVALPSDTFDVAFSHMVFEHLDDEQFLAVCKNTYVALKPGGTFAFVMTHPDRMVDIDGNLIKEYGPFTTMAPWGVELRNWRRSISQTINTIKTVGFEVELTEEIKFPEPTRDLDPKIYATQMHNYMIFKKYPAIRLSIKAIKPEV